MRNLKEFVTYFNKQWLSGDFVNWQLFNRPAGLATTNGPIESYNNTIKEFFTNRKKYNLLPSLEILSRQIKFESNRQIDFFEFVRPPSKMISDCKNLLNETKNNLIKESETRFTFKAPSRVTHCIELSDECSCPECCTCSCSYFLDKGYCSHLIMACLLSNSSHHGIQLLKKFKSKKRAGRPPLAAKALSID
jgi:hypothetical protein